MLGDPPVHFLGEPVYGIGHGMEEGQHSEGERYADHEDATGQGVFGHWELLDGIRPVPAVMAAYATLFGAGATDAAPRTTR